jgi:hypothetical protein
LVKADFKNMALGSSGWLILVLVVPTSLVPELLAFNRKSYVGQDFGELSRVAVLVLESLRLGGKSECWSS